MADELPEPLVPAETDLSGYEFMPYYGDRLRASDLNCRASDAEYRAAHNLWWSSWKQVPASSLPSDDVILCKLADLGRDQKTWLQVKARALHGFVLCSDGRYYHRILSVLALDAWAARLTASAKGRAGAGKRWGKQSHKSAMPGPVDKSSAGNASAISNGGSGNAATNNADSTGSATATKNDSKGEERRGKERKETTKAERYAPPAWVPAGPWREFAEMRTKLRKPMTDKAMELIVLELEKLQQRGFSPEGVLLQSVRKSWQDVYPIKDQGQPGNTFASQGDDLLERNLRAVGL